ncbi:MAG: ribose-phosphate pyrophosphokinase [Candidatus Magasanikbacteria bacterium]|nr:ribose-phosphate pyrophosphokinase [Candidatus Magasanikbacteria bacterium]
MNLKLFSGSAHLELAKRIARELKIPLGKVTSFTFGNDNRFVKIDEPVRGSDVYVVQTSRPPVDAYLFELLMLLRALRDASAARLTAVIPYLPYVRGDKRDQPRVCLTARLVADLIAEAGAERVLVMDLHAPQIQGFFSIPGDELFAAPLLIAHLKKHWDLTNAVLVAGDAGAAKLTRRFTDALKLPVAIMDKRRVGNKTAPVIKGVIGDVKQKNAILIDDEIASGATIIGDAKFLQGKAGAASVAAVVTHAVFSGAARAALNRSPLKRILVTNTIPTAGKTIRRLEVVDVAPRLAEGIRRLHAEKSLQNLNDLP